MMLPAHFIELERKILSLTMRISRDFVGEQSAGKKEWSYPWDYVEKYSRGPRGRLRRLMRDRISAEEYADGKIDIIIKEY